MNKTESTPTEIAKIRYRADGQWHELWVRAQLGGMPLGISYVDPPVLVVRAWELADLEYEVAQLVRQNQETNGWDMVVTDWGKGAMNIVAGGATVGEQVARG
jgi:hypothetical protein